MLLPTGLDAFNVSETCIMFVLARIWSFLPAFNKF